MSALTSNPQKSRKGISRILHAATFSLRGLRAAWSEAAFRQESVAAIVLIPLACWLGRNWTEVVILMASVLAVLVIELLNTGIESAIDRIGPEWHDLSGRAKDMGSAAVFLGVIFALGTWGSLIWLRVSA